MVSALRCVDKVIPYGDIDESIKHIDFDVFAIGGDQVHAGFQRAVKWCEANGKRVVRLARTEGISSLQIREGAGK
jgi:glycerol-3-phosphate cytidylyltransferase-like family protein